MDVLELCHSSLPDPAELVLDPPSVSIIDRSRLYNDLAMCRRLVHFILAGSAVLTGACGKQNYLNENDALRAKVLEQQKEIEDLNRRTAEMRTELEAVSSAPDEVSEEVRLATPHVVELALGRLTNVRRSEGAPASLLLYLNPADGRGRFTQLVGTVQISVFLLPMSNRPSTVGRLTATPLQVRDAYRHTLMSTHYSFEVPLDMPTQDQNSAGPETIFVRVLFTDGYTGKTFTAESSVNVN